MSNPTRTGALIILTLSVKNGLLQPQISYVDFCQVAGFTRSIGVYSPDSADIPPLRSTLVLLLILSALSRGLQSRAALINCSATCLFPKSSSFRSIHYNVSPLVKDVGWNTSGVPSSKTSSLLYSAAGISQSRPVSGPFTLYRDMCPLGTSEITPFRRKQGPQAFWAFCCRRAGSK